MFIFFYFNNCKTVVKHKMCLLTENRDYVSLCLTSHKHVLFYERCVPFLLHTHILMTCSLIPVILPRPSSKYKTSKIKQATCSLLGSVSKKAAKSTYYNMFKQTEDIIIHNINSLQ